MLHFECDYACGAAEEILRALTDTNSEQTPGYGEDVHCARAAALLKEKCGRDDIAVHFVTGGTQANLTVIAAALRPFEGALCAETGHINVHETGAVEATGHKVLPLPHHNGKISAAQIRAAMEAHLADSAFEHIVRPGLVYLSHPTELGTLYTRAELEEISAVCRTYGLTLFVDGARLVYGLAASGEVDLPLLARLCDAFTLGGTKAGLLFGEAIVLTDPRLNDCFRYHIKQRGGMLAKGRLLGVQYEALLDADTMERLGRRAMDLATRLRGALGDLGFSFLCETGTNQLFPIIDNRILERLAEKYSYSFWGEAGDGKSVVRLCTNVTSRPEEIEALIADLKAITAEVRELG